MQNIRLRATDKFECRVQTAEKPKTAHEKSPHNENRYEGFSSVGATRFERATSASQTQRSSQAELRPATFQRNSLERHAKGVNGSMHSLIKN